MYQGKIKVLWTQGSSDSIPPASFISITASVESPNEIADLSILSDKVSFYTRRGKNSEQCQTTLELYKEVQRSTAFIFVNRNNISFVILKKDSEHWPQLTKNDASESISIESLKRIDDDNQDSLYITQYPPDCDSFFQTYELIFKPSVEELQKFLAVNSLVPEVQDEQNNQLEKKRRIEIIIEVQAGYRTYFFELPFEQLIWYQKGPDVQLSTLLEFMKKAYPFLKIERIRNVPLFDDWLVKTLEEIWRFNYKLDVGFVREEDSKTFLVHCIFDRPGNPHHILAELVDKYPLDRKSYSNMISRMSSIAPGVDLGNCYKRTDKSVDQFIGYDNAVDEFDESTIYYDFYDDFTKEHVYLTSQQCIMVNTASYNGKFEPYIMVNKSGMARLRQAIYLELPRIRILENEDINNDVDTKRIDKVKRRLYDAVNDSLMAELYLMEVQGDEWRLREFIRKKVLRFVSSIEDDVNINDEDENANTNVNENRGEAVDIQHNVHERGIVGAYRATREKIQQFYRVWISSGLLIRLLNVFLKYTLRCFASLIILARLGLLSKRVIVSVVVLNLMRDEYIDAIGEFSGVTGFQIVLLCWLLLKFLHESLKRARNMFVSTIIRACLVGRGRGNQGHLYQLATFPLRQMQDIVLLVVTLLPPFAQEYRVQVTEHEARAAGAGAGPEGPERPERPERP